MSSTLTSPSAELLAAIESQPSQAVAPQRQLVVYVGLISVVASLAILVLQQTSFRLLAPVIGSSVETWPTIVGVFLLGIAAGNAAGGQLADRAPGVAMIRWCTALGGAAVVMLFDGNRRKSVRVN